MTKKTKHKNNQSHGKFSIVFGVVAVLILIGVWFVAFTPSFLTITYGDSETAEASDTEKEITEKEPEPEPEKPQVVHVPMPDAVKSLYMSACVAGSPSFREELIQLVDETELNAIVIDIKDFSGTISFDPEFVELAGTDGTGCRASDMKELIETMHEKNIYVIGRITVFQDPFYSTLHPELAVRRESDGAVWADHKGINFIEVGAKPYWDYIVDLSVASYNLGFDELNYDYVRFPSDGNMKDIYFPFSNATIESDPEFGKAKALEKFFIFLDKEIRDRDYSNEPVEHVNSDRPITSADLFGMTATNYDDLNIGQVLERALPYFDYIAPMVYPSHYPKTFMGFADPNDHPYEIVHHSMQTAADRAKTLQTSTSTPSEIRAKVNPLQLRSWIQDFDYGGDYDAADVRAQIQATYDAGLTSWMLWAPSNRYTRGALHNQ